MGGGDGEGVWLNHMRRASMLGGGGGGMTQLAPTGSKQLAQWGHHPSIQCDGRIGHRLRILHTHLRLVIRIPNRIHVYPIGFAPVILTLNILMRELFQWPAVGLSPIDVEVHLSRAVLGRIISVFQDKLIVVGHLIFIDLLGHNLGVQHLPVVQRVLESPSGDDTHERLSPQTKFPLHEGGHVEGRFSASVGTQFPYFVLYVVLSHDGAVVALGLACFVKVCPISLEHVLVEVVGAAARRH